MQCPPRALVHHPLLGRALVLQLHQPQQHLLAGQQLHHALARGLGSFHLLLAVEAAIHLLAHQQGADRSRASHSEIAQRYGAYTWGCERCHPRLKLAQVTRRMLGWKRAPGIRLRLICVLGGGRVPKRGGNQRRDAAERDKLRMRSPQHVAA